MCYCLLLRNHSKQTVPSFGALEEHTHPSLTTWLWRKLWHHHMVQKALTGLEIISTAEHFQLENDVFRAICLIHVWLKIFFGWCSLHLSSSLHHSSSFCHSVQDKANKNKHVPTCAQVLISHISFVCQQETEKLEDEKSDLQKEIESLQKEKDKLEFMLVAHNPVCKLPIDDRQQSAGHHQQHQHQHQQQCAPLPLTMRPSMPPRAQMNPVVVKQEPDDDVGDLGKLQRSVIKPICLGGGGMYCTDGDSLNTPVVGASTPAATPNAPSLIFTYPSMLEPESPSPSSESCSKAHRRSSSSGDQSSDSLNSPTLLALWARPSARHSWETNTVAEGRARAPTARPLPSLQCLLIKTQEHIEKSRPSWPCEPFPLRRETHKGYAACFLLFCFTVKKYFYL